MSDPTDPGGVGAAQAERTSSRYARVGENGSPVGSPLTIILAVVAVVVVNAAGMSGVAGQMTEQLAGLTYTMEGEGITSNAGAIETTVVYYNAGTGNPDTLAVAQTLAKDLGVAAPQEAPDPFPSDDSTGAATVYVMLGADLAGQDLPSAPTTSPPINTPAPTTTAA